MKTYIWSFTSRFLHWILAVAFVFAYTLGGEENSLPLHATFGMTVALSIIIRIIWGIIGPKFSKFTNFPVSLNSILIHIKNIFNKENIYIGHNPLASVIMITIYMLGLASAFTGMAIASKEGTVFPFLSNLPGNSHFYEEIHEVVVHLFLIAVILHLIGLFMDKILHHKQSAIFSMFTGYKNIEDKGIQLNLFQKIFSVFAIVFLLGTFIYNLSNPLPINEGEKKDKIEKNESHEEKDDDENHQLK